MLRVVVVGASGGIGSALSQHLAADARVGTLHATSREPSTLPAPTTASATVRQHALDATDAQAVATFADSLHSDEGPIDWVINCAGLLHDTPYMPEKSIGSLEAAFFEQNLRVNCLSSLLLARYLHPRLTTTSSGLFAAISARIGSIEDNRLGGWYSYRCSKAALNMALKTLSIEWQRSKPNIKVLALHPGTTDTALSRPFQRNVPTGKLFSAEKTAALLAARLFEAVDLPSGRFIDYEGREIPW